MGIARQSEREREGEREAMASSFILPLLAHALPLCAAGILGGLLLACLDLVLSHLWYRSLLFLEKKTLISRLAPAIPVTVTTYSKESFFSVAVGPMFLAALLFACRARYLETWHLSVDLWGAWKLTWVIMVLHDAYFWVIHTMLHKHRRLYKRLHQLHHSTYGDLTVFSTAYGDLIEVALTFTVFYGGVALWVYMSSSWNLFHVLVLYIVVNNVDLMGHCGYDLPFWVVVPASMGVLLTPGGQGPIDHYIHHLDQSSNRGLYFTWWDRLAGTYRPDHPAIGSKNPYPFESHAILSKNRNPFESNLETNGELKRDP